MQLNVHGVDKEQLSCYLLVSCNKVIRCSCWAGLRHWTDGAEDGNWGCFCETGCLLFLLLNSASLRSSPQCRPQLSQACRVGWYPRDVTALLFPRAVLGELEHGECSVIPLRPNTWQPARLCLWNPGPRQVCIYRSWDSRVEFSFQQAACSLDSDALLWNAIGRRRKTKFRIRRVDFNN